MICKKQSEGDQFESPRAVSRKKRGNGRPLAYSIVISILSRVPVTPRRVSNMNNGRETLVLPEAISHFSSGYRRTFIATLAAGGIHNKALFKSPSLLMRNLIGLLAGTLQV